jgi:nucleotide-binding universal stress UspA family protein
MAELHRILVPTDFTETSERAIDWAIELGTRLGSTIAIMHAYELPVVGFPDGALVATVEVASRIAEASREALESSISRHRGRGVPLEAILREGAAWQEINNVADEIHADLVVIGTHGRKGLARALLGSVAEKVVRHGNHPVVMIRGPK